MSGWSDVLDEIDRVKGINKELVEALEHCRKLAGRDGPPISMATNILNEIEEITRAALAKAKRKA